jgi:AraC-like DNA-binding protein
MEVCGQQLFSLPGNLEDFASRHQSSKNNFGICLIPSLPFHFPKPGLPADKPFGPLTDTSAPPTYVRQSSISHSDRSGLISELTNSSPRKGGRYFLLLPTHHDPTMSTKLFVKYMVSLRCKMLVKEELKKLGLHYVIVDLGMVEVLENISEAQREQLQIRLKKSGLELLDNKKGILIEKIKNVIIEMVHYSDEIPKVNYSDYISEKMGYDYTYLANIFSEVKGTTIQHFIIMHKIEKVKELLIYDELTLSEISYKLHYSSVAHLSNQFKKITGLTPTYYKHLKNKRKKNLEDI